MEESAKLRRGKLIEEIRHYCDLLSILKFADGRAPTSMNEAIASSNQEIAEKVRAMEIELHALNVQLIREGLSAAKTDDE